MPVVNRVRKELSADGGHEHIQGVCTTDGSYSARQEVVDGLRRGVSWTTVGGGVIREIRHCPRSGCPATPYITTRADESIDNNLESLPRC